MGVKKDREIYEYVRCETKHCVNNFKLLKEFLKKGNS